MNKITDLPTKDYLHECFIYDYNTGLLTWKERPSCHFSSSYRAKLINGRQKGKIINSLDSKGYVYLKLNQKNYRAHRIIWKMVHGDDPVSFIDHINCTRTDNRIENLREANNAQNKRNTTIKSNNTSGFKGVSFDKRRNKWTSRIAINQKQIHLGRYNTPEEAHKAYCEASAEYHKEYGRVA